MNKRIFKEQTSDTGDVPFFKIGTFGKVPDSFISKELFNEYKNKYPFPNVGDILISASGSIGKLVVYQGKDEYFQDSNIVWLDHNGKIDNLFLKQFYSMVNWKELEGSTIKRLYNKDILKTKISIPKLVEQSKIGQFFCLLEKIITLYQRKLTFLSCLNQFFLQQLFPSKTTTPSIRFNGFVEAWEQYSLNEVAKITMGQSPNSKYYTDDSSYHILVQGNADLENGKVSPRVWTKKATKFAEIDDILFSVRAPVGEIGKTKYNVAIGRGVASIKADEFIFQFLSNLKNKNFWKKLSTGSTFESINSNDLKNLQILVPSESEKNKIGHTLKTLDNLITFYQQQYELLIKTKQIYLKLLFV